MSTLQDVVTAAFRESGITATGVTPDTAEAAEAVTILSNLIASVFYDEAGEGLTSYNVGSNNITYEQNPDQTLQSGDVIPAYSRLFLNLTGPTTLYLPSNPEKLSLINVTDVSNNLATYPLTLNGNGRLIGGAASVVLNTNGISTNYLYSDSAPNMGWTAYTGPAALTDVFPFPDAYIDMFAIMLAMRIGPRYGAVVAPESLQALTRLKKRFEAQYNHSREVSSERALYTLTNSKAFNKTTFHFSTGK